MRLPQSLLDAIQGEVEKIERRPHPSPRKTGAVRGPRRRLVEAAAQITERNKAADYSRLPIATEAERAAYLAVRFRATYAANRRVFSEIALLLPHAATKTLLDLGAGPGTALLAAREAFPELEKATLLEADERWIAIGKTLAEKSGPAAAPEAQWVRQDLRSGFSGAEHDLVVISYALGELAPAAAEALIRNAWSCARNLLAIIEPGTPRGFATVNAARAELIGAGAEILAPCPHKQACPMAAGGDWCHFAQRLERTAEHRQLKGGALGYEDEKFSYLIASRQSVPAQAARIVRHPGKHSGHIQLELCTSAGLIENRTITRSKKEAFRAARKAEWGDVWEE